MFTLARVAIAASLFLGSALGQATDVPAFETVVLSGRVVTQEGAAVANASVVLNSLAGRPEKSFMRTDKDGQFAFDVAMDRAYELHFESPGAAPRDLRVKVDESAQSLKDIVLDVHGSPSPVRPFGLPEQVAGLVKEEWADGLRYSLVARGEVFEQNLRVTQFGLREGNDAVLVQGAGSYFDGPSARPMLLFVNTDGLWWKAFGESNPPLYYHLDTLAHASNGWPDLEVWRHLEYATVRLVYEYGQGYERTHCDELQSVDHGKPIFKPCHEMTDEILNGMGQAPSGGHAWTLAEAPLTSEQRDLIYRTVAKPVHDDFEDKDEEIMTQTYVGTVQLSVARSTQLLVSGNCPRWVFATVQGRMRLVLESEAGSMFFIQKATHLGFHDVAVYWNSSAATGIFTVYRWNGVKYEQFWCIFNEGEFMSQGPCQGDQ